MNLVYTNLLYILFLYSYTYLNECGDAQMKEIDQIARKPFDLRILRKEDFNMNKPKQLLRKIAPI